VTTSAPIAGLKPDGFGPAARHAFLRRLPGLVCAVLCLTSLAAGVGSAAEKFKPFKLKTVEGGQTAFADVLGKATLVVFFFPTCAFCNAAFPEIQRLNDTYKEHGLSTVGINVLPQQERLIPEWRIKHGYTIPILLGSRSMQRDYELVMTPTHYLIDSQGKVLAKRAGFKSGDEQELERQIRQALGLVP
jgi:thiol-disulfide isomerase/thioredoxin